MKTIETKNIICEFDRTTTDEEIQARAKSIRGVGLIHSVKIQPTGKGKYVVVAGRKSFSALTQVLGKDKLEIPNEISIIEGDPELIAFAENDERTELSLIEQIEKLDALSKRMGIAELASHLSYSPTWIAARIRLSELADSWKEVMKRHDFPDFVIGHYEAIAKYPAEVQEEILEYCEHWQFDGKIGIKRFEKDLKDHFSFDLSTLPWNTDGEISGCGSCLACLDRINDGFLFPDMTEQKKVICQNRSYIEGLMGEYIVERIEEERSNYSEIILVSQEQRMPSEFPLMPEEYHLPHSWIKTTKKAGGQKALIVNGPKVGNCIYVSLYGKNGHTNGTDSEPSGGKKTRTLAERKELKNRQRKRHAISALIDYLEHGEYQQPSVGVIYRLIACLGTDSILGYGNGSCDIKEFGLKAYQQVLDLEERDAFVWQKVLINIVRDLKQGQKGSVPASWEGAETISSIVGFDLHTAVTAAITALPDPKSWAALEAAV